METEGGSQLFETAEKGGVMKNGSLKRGLMPSSKMYVYGITKNRLEIYFELS